MLPISPAFWPAMKIKSKITSTSKIMSTSRITSTSRRIGELG